MSVKRKPYQGGNGPDKKAFRWLIELVLRVTLGVLLRTLFEHLWR